MLTTTHVLTSSKQDFRQQQDEADEANPSSCSGIFDCFADCFAASEDLSHKLGLPTQYAAADAVSRCIMF